MGAKRCIGLGMVLALFFGMGGCGKEESQKPRPEQGPSAKQSAEPKRPAITLRDLETLEPLCGKPFFLWSDDNKIDKVAQDKILGRLSALANLFDSVPGREGGRDRWAVAMTKVTDTDFESNKTTAARLLMHLNQRMGVMFNEDEF